MMPISHARFIPACALAALLAACGGGSDTASGSSASTSSSAPANSPVDAPAAGGLRTGDAPGFPATMDGLAPEGRRPLSDSGYSIDVSSREAVRLFYKTIFGSSTSVPPGWVGDVAACNAGDTSSAFKAAALRRVNWFRAMAGVPAGIQFDVTFNAKAQQAALLMSANNQLSHFPPSSWACYNATGAEAAGKSNIGIGNNGAATVEGYMRDPGATNNVVGHRRWILYPQTQFMGVGDVQGTVRANALWIQDANLRAARPAVRDDFVAWPPRGYVPYQAVYPRWSISYPGASFSGATVTMTENGVPMATRLETVTDGFGENTLVWVPGSYADGSSWARPAADTVYNVTVANVMVNGAPRSFSYTTTVFDPDATVANGALNITGAAQVAPGVTAAYGITPWSGATAYQWRSISSAAYALSDTGDQGELYFAAGISAGYTAIASGIAATGANAYHLAHTQPVDQVLQLRATLVGRAASSLSFASRLGQATPAQSAIVEASTDEGATWTVLAQQAGGTTEAGFSVRTIPLAAYADKTFLLRFRYAYTIGGTYYPQSSAGVGWYIDDVRLTNADAVSAVAGPSDTATAGFSFTAAAPGDGLLQARAQMYGYNADWGTALRIGVSASAFSSARADCLFNWAERNYTQLFTSGPTAATSAPYYYRFYPGKTAYLGVSTADGNVYYLKGGVLENVGPATTWYATAGCS